LEIDNLSNENTSEDAYYDANKEYDPNKDELKQAAAVTTVLGSSISEEQTKTAVAMTTNFGISIPQEEMKPAAAMATLLQSVTPESTPTRGKFMRPTMAKSAARDKVLH
jgi:hypothetical protein